MRESRAGGERGERSEGEERASLSLRAWVSAPASGGVTGARGRDRRTVGVWEVGLLWWRSGDRRSVTGREGCFAG
jgi:hypothetical protein